MCHGFIEECERELNAYITMQLPSDEASCYVKFIDISALLHE